MKALTIRIQENEFDWLQQAAEAAATTPTGMLRSLILQARESAATDHRLQALEARLLAAIKQVGESVAALEPAED